MAPSRHKKAEDGPRGPPGSPLEAPRGPQEAPQGLKISSGRAWKCTNITAKHSVPSQEGDSKGLEMALSRNEKGLGMASNGLQEAPEGSQATPRKMA